MKRLVLSLLLVATATPALNACSPASTQGNLDRIPPEAMHHVMDCLYGKDISNLGRLNRATRQLVPYHVAAVIAQLRAHPFMADKSEEYITEYARSVIKTGKAPKAVHDALIAAAKAGNLDHAQNLLTAPYIDVNARDDENKTALIWAAFWGDADVVALLLADPRTDVNARDKWGHTALIVAADLDLTAIATALLADLRTDVNAHTEKGNTALIVAADLGHTAIATALLADPRLDAKQIHAARECARHDNNAEVVDLLDEYIAAHPEAAAPAAGGGVAGPDAH